MRGWNPESEEDPAERLPLEHQLPEPPWEYAEIETMKAFGCWSLSAWRALPLDERAELMAHEIHRSLRERWYAAKLRAARKQAAPGEPGKTRSQAPWDVVQRMFLEGVAK